MRQPPDIGRAIGMDRGGTRFLCQQADLAEAVPGGQPPDQHRLTALIFADHRLPPYQQVQGIGRVPFPQDAATRRYGKAFQQGQDSGADRRRQVTQQQGQVC
ncbi:hypothetical protein GCM10027256_30890 [Novispirillum itersonii subsp. nipponicum]